MVSGPSKPFPTPRTRTIRKIGILATVAWLDSELNYKMHMFVDGFAFVYMEDERDAADAVGKLDHVEFGRKARRRRVEWTKLLRAIQGTQCLL